MNAEWFVIALAIIPAILLIVAVLFDWLQKKWGR